MARSASITRRRVFRVLTGLVIVAGALGQASHAQRCDPFWTAVGVGGGADGQVRALAVFDDGSGPALYVGGDFSVIGGVSANHIAKWDGLRWSALREGVDRGVCAFVVYDEDGQGPLLPALYVGGWFAQAGSVPANRIAKWDGKSWVALGAGTSGAVSALVGFDDDGPGPHWPALYVGGEFREAGGIEATYIAKWGRGEWSAVGGGTDGFVNALTVFDDDGPGPRLAGLYVGGGFRRAGNKWSYSIARWDGEAWEELGIGMGNGTVRALTTYDGDGSALYAGGQFIYAGGRNVYSIAKWYDKAWHALTVGVRGFGSEVLALTTFDDGTGQALYVGGNFDTAGGLSANGIARWDGRSWSRLGSGVTYPLVSAMHAYDDDGPGPYPATLFAGGTFTKAGDKPANYIAAWTVRPCADLNCDARINNFDIDPFVLALGDPAAYRIRYPFCDIKLGDMNRDGRVDNFDIDPFVACLTQGKCP